MKKGWKIFWTICGSLFGIGIVLTIAGFALGINAEAVKNGVPDWIGLKKDISYAVVKEYDYGEVTEGRTEYQYEGIHEIEVEAAMMNLQILADASLENEVKVAVSDDDYAAKLELFEKGNTLAIRTNKTLKSGDDVGTVWVYIPEELLSEVDIEVEAGNVYIDKVNAKSLNVSVGAGEAVIGQFEVSEADFSCGAGKVHATGNAKRELDAECGTGKIELVVDGVEEDYNYEVSCGIGTITIGNAKHSGLGSEKKYSNGAAKDMSIDCGIGEIRVTFK